jgi:hypothetical protein
MHTEEFYLPGASRTIAAGLEINNSVDQISKMAYHLGNVNV